MSAASTFDLQNLARLRTEVRLRGSTPSARLSYLGPRSGDEEDRKE